MRLLPAILITSISTAVALPAQSAPQRDIDLAICLDTSGSMNGLLDSARQSIWAIVNDLATARPTPRLRIALLTFGSKFHAEENGYVSLDIGLTRDLDEVSEKLFALSAHGSVEYVGRVMQTGLDRLRWSPKPDALRLMIVAGNESADQDRLVSFQEQARRAIRRDIQVNAIYCGKPGDRDAASWRQLAQLAEGHFHAIDQNGTVALQSPFDPEIATLSATLNSTYIPIGVRGGRAWANQVAQDTNAAKLNTKAVTQRALTKCTTNYHCSWDLLDSLRTRTVTLETVKITELPARMQAMSLVERRRYVAVLQARRTKIQSEIRALNAKRDAWCAAEKQRRKLGGAADFESAVRRAVRAQAERKGLRFEKSPAKKKSRKTLFVRKC